MKLNEKNNLKLYEDAWLGLGDLSELNLDKNIMIHRSKSDIENPDMHL